MVVIKLNKSYSKQFAMIFTLIVFTISGKKQSDLIYILEWTYSRDSWMYHYLELGQKAFLQANCSFQNCFFTDDISHFESLLDFDVVLFNGVAVHEIKNVNELPPNRSEIQVYIFASFEPATFYPISDMFNGYFNITWSYKLVSDIVHPYLVVKNHLGEIIGPKPNMYWKNLKKFKNTDQRQIVKTKIRNKKYAVAWIISNCTGANDAYKFGHSLINELSKYGHHVDIFGKCVTLDCPKSELTTECFDKVEELLLEDYYFILAFENTLSEDYVTEKVLHGLHNFVVPVVYGGANYTRFMPDEIYIDALTLGVYELASIINDIMNNSRRYLDFFKWHDHYTFHASYEHHYYDVACKLCKFLNNNIRSDKRKVYENFTRWWNFPILRNENIPEIRTDKYPERPTESPIVLLDGDTIGPDIEDKNNIVTSFLRMVISAIFE